MLQMPRPPAQSEISIVRAPDVALPVCASLVALPPRASDGASELATRWVIRLALLLLAALALLCAIGPHIPSGE